ncbi:MAG: hypothetical protein OEQ39_21745, partial [Gammaproteobacteria bacterium]|nr:hypothetical protein [Gammaproteobacteria bacterium]
MRHYPYFTFVLIACGLLFTPGATYAQQPVSADISLHDWSVDNAEWLKRQVTPNDIVPNPEPGRRRLVVSYDIAPEDFPQGFHRSATYDNALAALAFLITGDIDAAAFTLYAVARLVRADGSLWFSYNTANAWPDENYHESAIVRTGAVSWVGYALAFFLTHAPPCDADDRGCWQERDFFRETAVRLANYLRSLQANDPGESRYGLLRLGYGTIELAYRAESDEIIEIYLDEPAMATSSENNIAAWFFFRQLHRLTEDDQWDEVADQIAEGLLTGMWNEEIGQFNRGIHPSGGPDTVKALDCASWGALFLRATGETAKARLALQAAEEFYRAQDGDVLGYRPYFDHPIYMTADVDNYFFPNPGNTQWREIPLVWSEGTLGVALLYLRMGETQRTREIVERLRALQVENSGLRYASKEVPYQMTSAPGVAASAWLILVTE